MYFDTGAYVSAISDDLVDEKYREYLKSEENTVPYVVPQDRMLNRLSGVPLGH